MPITINGSGSVSGIDPGGLPDGCVVQDDLADGAAAVQEAIDGASTPEEIKVALEVTP